MSILCAVQNSLVRTTTPLTSRPPLSAPVFTTSPISVFTLLTNHHTRYFRPSQKPWGSSSRACDAHNKRNGVCTAIRQPKEIKTCLRLRRSGRYRPLQRSANCFLIIDFDFGDGITKRKRLNIRSAKAGHLVEDNRNPLDSLGQSNLAESGVQTVNNTILHHDQRGAYCQVERNETSFLAETTTNIDVHGTIWEPPNNNEDEEPIGGNFATRSFQIRTVTGELIGADCDYSGRSPIDYFLMMFPPRQLHQMVLLTNRELGRHDLSYTTAGEVLKFIGVLMLCTIYEFGERRTLWSKTPPSKDMPAPNFGKTGMSRSRFDSLFRCIRFSEQPQSSEQYRWTLVDDFVIRLCEHRVNHVIPGDTICVEESISRWYGQGGDWINHGLPIYVAIDRKPENGCEIQNSACGHSGIMIRLRLVKTAEEEHAHLNETESGLLHGTVVLKELVSPWALSERIVCADSYFASVTAALELKKMGLRFIGVIKTATRNYPLAALGGIQLNERGESHCLVNKSNGKIQLMAMVWVDRDRRYFILSASSRATSTRYSRKRWRQIDDRPDAAPERVELTVPQPKGAEIYYSCCALIDRHNRCRQDDLSLEKKIGTLDWSMRVNISILGICIVDSWLAFKTCKGQRSLMTQREFYTLLTTELIDNTFDVISHRDKMFSKKGLQLAAASQGAVYTFTLLLQNDAVSLKAL